MPSIETYRKQAKQLARWHREHNYSIGGKVRRLARFRDLSDAEILAMPMPLALAQEIVAVEAGFGDWAALKSSATETSPPHNAANKPPELSPAVPVLFVRDVTRSAEFYRDSLGFAIDFLHGQPAFYASVSREFARIHLRHVDQPNFVELSAREGSLILATIETKGVRALFSEYEACGVDFAQRLVRQAWGGLDFHVRDPDGNVLSFVEYRR